ncbi:MAG: tyrosine-type recombinase/integrase [Acidimicrobiales bacterium]
MAGGTKRAGRRPAGEGSVYRGSDGRWRGVADLGWADGKRQRKYVRAATQAEVLAKLRQIRREAEVGVVADDRITVGQFLTRWLKVNAPGTVSGSTLDDYSHTVRLHLEPTLGRKRLSQLSVADVDAVWAAKREAGYKPNSVRIMRAVLRRALGQAEREGLVQRNVAAISQPPRISQSEGRSLTIDQARALLDTARGEQLEAAYLLLLSYGLRRGELLGLAWADLDVGARTLAVRQAVRTRKTVRGEDGTYVAGSSSRIELAELKTRRSRRTLFLTEGVAEALQTHRTRQKLVRKKAGALWVESGLIFTSVIGTPMDPDNFAKQFVRLCESAGLGHWHPHEARHSAASVMLAQGVPLEVVSEVLGHSSIYITKDVYGHLVEGAKRDAAERMTSVLLG